MTVDDFQGVSGTPRAHPDPVCAIFVRDYFKWAVFGSMTKHMGSSKTHGLLKNSWAPQKLMGSSKTHGLTGFVGIRES